jgi:hypothetical protein
MDKFRILALNLIALQREHGPKMQNTVNPDTSAPARLIHLLEECSKEVDQRPTMRDVVRSLEGIVDALGPSGKIEWQEIKPGAVLGAETGDLPPLLGNIVVESFSFFEDSASGSGSE